MPDPCCLSYFHYCECIVGNQQVLRFEFPRELNETAHKILVLITFASSVGSDQLAQMHGLPRAFTVGTHKVGTYKMAQSNIEATCGIVS